MEQPVPGTPPPRRVDPLSSAVQAFIHDPPPLCRSVTLEGELWVRMDEAAQRAAQKACSDRALAYRSAGHPEDDCVGRAILDLVTWLVEWEGLK